jgi:hypothetical protein
MPETVPLGGNAEATMLTVNEPLPVPEEGETDMKF